MTAKKKNRGFSDEEKALVAYFKDKLKERGIKKFPRDWHLKQLSVARNMLAGENAPTEEQWKECIDWLFRDKFWKDKVDHLARVEAMWPKYVLKTGGEANGRAGEPGKVPKRGSYGEGFHDDELPI